MNNEVVGLIFAGISAVCAVISIIQTGIGKRNKKEIQGMLAELRTNIRNVDELFDLKPQLEELGKIAKSFRKVSSGTTKQRGFDKSELDDYVAIKEKTAIVLEKIPLKYITIRELLSEINSALSFCINSGKIFRELDRNNQYSYDFVEKKYHEVISELNDTIKGIKYFDN